MQSHSIRITLAYSNRTALAVRSHTTSWHPLLRMHQVVVQKELDETSSEALVFRRNSVASKLATFYARRYGRDMLLSTLQARPFRAAPAPALLSPCCRNSSPTIVQFLTGFLAPALMDPP